MPLMRLLLIGPEWGLNSLPLLSIIKTKNSIILIFYITICLIFNDTIPQNNVNSLGNKELCFQIGEIIHVTLYTISERGGNLCSICKCPGLF
jgi:hypothetical protein